MAMPFSALAVERALAPNSTLASGRLAGTATSSSDRLQGHCQE